MGHRRLHPDAEHVELEQAEVLHVVLVELAHGVAGEARLDRGAVEQGGVGEQHPAGVHGDVAGQAVEPLGEAEQQPEPLLAQPGGPQLGQLAQRRPGVAGPDVGEGLGDGVDLPAGHPEGGADVADRVTHPVGVHHRDRDAALPAVAVEDRVVDLETPVGLHVDVDVGQRLPPRGEEPLHEEPVAQRVDAGDAEQVVDQAAGARPPGRGADAEVADHAADVGDGEEVGGEAEAADDLQLVVEPLPDPLPRSVAVAAADAGLAADPQHLVGAPVAAAPGSVTSSSGKCTSPSPRSARGSTAHRSATARVRASRERAADSPLPIPASRHSSSATAAISLPDLRNPSALPRSTWRTSSGTSRRAASRTSTVTASVRSA